MIHLKLNLVSIVVFVAVGAAGQLYSCPNPEAFNQLDARLLNCGQNRWEPFTSGPVSGYPDIRSCCYKLETACLYNKLVRSMCEVSGDFGEEIRLRYGQVAGECQNMSLEVDEQVCAQQRTLTVSDDMCNQFIPCSLNDRIPWNPNPIDIPYPEYEPNDNYTETVNESLVNRYSSGVAGDEIQVFLKVILILMSALNLSYELNIS